MKNKNERIDREMSECKKNFTLYHKTQKNEDLGDSSWLEINLTMSLKNIWIVLKLAWFLPARHCRFTKSLEIISPGLWFEAAPFWTFSQHKKILGQHWNSYRETVLSQRSYKLSYFRKKRCCFTISYREAAKLLRHTPLMTKNWARVTPFRHLGECQNRALLNMHACNGVVK